MQALWQEATGGKHPISPALWQAVTVGDPSFLSGDVLVEGDPAAPDGFVLVKRWSGQFSGCERYADLGWIGLLAVSPAAQRRGVGRRLLAAAERRLAGQGARRVALGGSFHHVMPGVPGDWAVAQDFFTQAGYLWGREVCDVRRNLAIDPLPAPLLLGDGLVARPLDPADVPALQSFLEREFPGRWARDIAHFLATGGNPAQIMGLFREKSPIGFAHLHPPGSSGALRWAGFCPHLAALGPIGVAQSTRGQGLGLALLSHGLAVLRAYGATDTVIDWTDLLDFYARLGFVPWLRYRQSEKELK